MEQPFLYPNLCSWVKFVSLQYSVNISLIRYVNCLLMYLKKMIPVDLFTSTILCTTTMQLTDHFTGNPSKSKTLLNKLTSYVMVSVRRITTMIVELQSKLMGLQNGMITIIWKKSSLAHQKLITGGILWGVFCLDVPLKYPLTVHQRKPLLSIMLMLLYLKLSQLPALPRSIGQYPLLHFYENCLTDHLLNVSHFLNSFVPDSQFRLRRKLDNCDALLT